MLCFTVTSECVKPYLMCLLALPYWQNFVSPPLSLQRTTQSSLHTIFTRILFGVFWWRNKQTNKNNIKKTLFCNVFSAFMHIIYIIFPLSPSSCVASRFLKRVNTLIFDRFILVPPYRTFFITVLELNIWLEQHFLYTVWLGTYHIIVAFPPPHPFLLFWAVTLQGKLDCPNSEIWLLVWNQ